MTELCSIGSLGTESASIFNRGNVNMANKGSSHPFIIFKDTSVRYCFQRATRCFQQAPGFFKSEYFNGFGRCHSSVFCIESGETSVTHVCLFRQRLDR